MCKLFFCSMLLVGSVAFAAKEGLPTHLALDEKVAKKVIEPPLFIYNLRDFSIQVAKHSGKFFIFERKLDEIPVDLEFPSRVRFEYFYWGFIFALHTNDLQTYQLGKFVKITRSKSTLKRPFHPIQMFFSRHVLAKDIFQYWDENLRTIYADCAKLSDHVILIADEKNVLESIQEFIEKNQ